MASIFSNRIEYFLKCAQYRSLKEAAKKIGVTQSALSTAIKGLEQELGSTLFERDPKGVQLSPEGKILYQELKKHRLAITDVLDHKLKSNVPSALRIGSVPHFYNKFLFQALSELQDKLPPIHHLVALSLHVKEAVQAGDLDFGFISWTSKPKELKYFLVRQDPVGILGLSNKFAHLARATSFEQLENEPWIHFPKQMRTWAESLDSTRSGYAVRDIFTYRRLLLEGRGIGDIQLDFFTDEELKKFTTAQVPSKDPLTSIYGICRPDAPPSVIRYITACIELLQTS